MNTRITRALAAFALSLPCALQAFAADDRVTKMQQYVEDLQEQVRQLPREGFDPDAVVEKIGRDPEKLFGWVREQTHYVPYQGALRGPGGVLMDRVGNDLDRSLLLAELLTTSGFDVRLAHAQLDETAAKQVLAAAVAAPFPKADTGRAKSFVATVDQWSQTQADALIKLLPRNAQADSVAASQLAAAKEHWWVQYQPADQWVDLDAGSAKAGEHLGGGEVNTINSPAKNVMAELPRELKHRVTFRVVVERWDGGKLQEDTALDWTVNACNDPAFHVLLTHRSEGAPHTVAGDDANAAKKKLLAQKKWRPVLTIDGHARGPKTFDETGVLAAADDGAGGVGNANRGMMGGFGGAMGGGGDAASGVLTAEWLDVVIESPGKPARTIRCEVFDSIGPAARAAGALDKPNLDDTRKLDRAAALNGQCDSLVTSCRISRDYFRFQMDKRPLTRKNKLIKAAGDDSPAGQKAVLSATIPQPLELFSYLRSFAIHGAENTYVDGPNIVRLTLRRRVQADGSLKFAAMCDLADNCTAALAKTPADAFAAVLRRGLADTAFEPAAVCNWDGTDDTARAPENTRLLFQRAAAKAITPAAITSGDQFNGNPPDVKQRAANELKAGHELIGLSAPLDNRTGWWRIDPATGQTVGMMDTGLHSALTEESEMQAEIAVTEEFLEDEVLTDEEILREQEAKDFFHHFEQNLTEQGKKDIFWVLDAAFDCW